MAPPEALEGLDLARWAKETEGTIFRNEKVSSRHERRRLRQVDEEEAALEGEVADLRVEEASLASTAKKPTREHKRLKTWVSWVYLLTDLLYFLLLLSFVEQGKKNKKLRDKDPYSEDKGPEAFLAHFTNRTANSMKVT